MHTLALPLGSQTPALDHVVIANSMPFNFKATNAHDCYFSNISSEGFLVHVEVGPGLYLHDSLRRPLS